MIKAQKVELANKLYDLISVKVPEAEAKQQSQNDLLESVRGKVFSSAHLIQNSHVCKDGMEGGGTFQLSWNGKMLKRKIVRGTVLLAVASSFSNTKVKQTSKQTNIKANASTIIYDFLTLVELDNTHIKGEKKTPPYKQKGYRKTERTNIRFLTETILQACKI